jgi:hypothetical protein
MSGMLSVNHASHSEEEEQSNPALSRALLTTKIALQRCYYFFASGENEQIADGEKEIAEVSINNDVDGGRQ